jgi:DNA-binding response OmpR family regulator
VEDEQEIGELIGLYLAQEGIDSTLCETAEAGLKEVCRGEYDLVVLDINLPGMDGFEFLQTFRRQSNLPVVIVSSREADEDVVLGLGVGADDFVTKPFTPKVLVARIRAHLRRFFDSRAEGRRLYCFGPYCLDPEGYSLKRDNEPLAVPPRELELLAYLVLRAGDAIGVEQLYQAVWGNRYGDLATVAVHIQRLRKRIERDPARPRYILTVHGAGYKFAAEELERKGSELSP